MNELPDDVYPRITEISEQGSRLFDENDFEGALERFTSAWELLPSPKETWNATLWLQASQADCLFYLERYAEARLRLHQVLVLPDAVGNTFIHLRLGQTEFELGNFDAAANELIRAYGVGGAEVFSDQDPKYLRFLESRADLRSHQH